MSQPKDVYTHGHHESVLRSHAARTVENSAAYLAPTLQAGLTLLDVGCGPGSITIDLARWLAPGEVIGVERSETAHATARAAAVEAGLSNARFEVGDVYALKFADDCFDIVHAHQVLQHLSDPIAALREMRRVCKPGGVIAVRDADHSAMSWYPANEGLDRWMHLYLQVARANAAEPNAGRHLLAWAHAAGLESIEPSASVWFYATEATRTEWGEGWAVRVTESDFARQAVSAGFATEEELTALAQGWRDWSQNPDGWFTIPHGEMLCVKSEFDSP